MDICCTPNSGAIGCIAFLLERLIGGIYVPRSMRYALSSLRMTLLRYLFKVVVCVLSWTCCLLLSDLPLLE